MKILNTIVAASLAAASLPGQQGNQPAKPPVVTSIDSVDLAGVGTDHVRFEVHARATATRGVTVARIKFEEMRLGDIPFYLSPIDQKLQLKSGQAAALPSLGMTIYFRDLDSLAPLLEVVRSGEIRIRGLARADLDLNLIEKIALRKWSGHADIPIDTTVAVSLPGGFAGRAAATFALTAAQATLGVAGSVLNGLRTSQQKWNGELKTDFTESLVAAESNYRLLTNEGQTIDVTTRGLGFRISEDRVLLTGEVAEPWKFDVDTAALLQSHKATIVEESRNVLIWPLGGKPENSASFANGRLLVEKIATAQQSEIVPEGNRNPSVPVARRDTDSNYAVVRLTKDEDKRKAIPSAPSEAGQSWDRVAVFKLNADGMTETIFVPAHRQGNRLTFDMPVDDETFGSPVMAPGGAVGMVQDERSAMILPPRL